MKNLIASMLVLSLSGCAMVDAYFMAKFDSNEYLLVDEIRSVAQVNAQRCDNREYMNNVADNLYISTIKLKNYAEYIPNNEKTIPLTQSLLTEVEKLQKRYQNPDKISLAYCKSKLGIIESSAETVQEVIGSKPR